MSCRISSGDSTTARRATIGGMDAVSTDLDRAAAFLDRVAQLNAKYRAGEIRAHVPERLRDGEESLESLVAALFPLSTRARAAAVENAIKAVLMNRVMTTPDGDGGFIVSFDGAFHGRTLGALAVTHRKKARLGFPTFDWPHIPFPVDVARAPKETARREERSLKQLWDLLGSGRIPGAEKSKDTYRREMDALDEFLAQPGSDANSLNVFV